MKSNDATHSTHVPATKEQMDANVGWWNVARSVGGRRKSHCWCLCARLKIIIIISFHLVFVFFLFGKLPPHEAIKSHTHIVI